MKEIPRCSYRNSKRLWIEKLAKANLEHDTNTENKTKIITKTI
jgi:hypothetical protein